MNSGFTKRAKGRLGFIVDLARRVYCFFLPFFLIGFFLRQIKSKDDPLSEASEGRHLDITILTITIEFRRVYRSTRNTLEKLYYYIIYNDTIILHLFYG